MAHLGIGGVEMTDDDLPRYAPKAFVAKEILSLLYVLPRKQILQIDLTAVRGRDLRLIYREIKKTYGVKSPLKGYGGVLLGLKMLEESD